MTFTLKIKVTATAIPGKVLIDEVGEENAKKVIGNKSIKDKKGGDLC